MVTLGRKIERREKEMTIKELYEWSLKHNSEDYELLIFDQWEEVAKPVTEDRLENIHESKKVTVA